MPSARSTAVVGPAVVPGRGHPVTAVLVEHDLPHDTHVLPEGPVALLAAAAHAAGAKFLGLESVHDVGGVFDLLGEVTVGAHAQFPPGGGDDPALGLGPEVATVERRLVGDVHVAHGDEQVARADVEGVGEEEVQVGELHRHRPRPPVDAAGGGVLEFELGVHEDRLGELVPEIGDEPIEVGPVDGPGLLFLLHGGREVELSVAPDGDARRDAVDLAGRRGHPELADQLLVRTRHGNLLAQRSDLLHQDVDLGLQVGLIGPDRTGENSHNQQSDNNLQCSVRTHPGTPFIESDFQVHLG